MKSVSSSPPPLKKKMLTSSRIRSIDSALDENNYDKMELPDGWGRNKWKTFSAYLGWGKSGVNREKIGQMSHRNNLEEIVCLIWYKEDLEL